MIYRIWLTRILDIGGDRWGRGPNPRIFDDLDDSASHNKIVCGVCVMDGIVCAARLSFAGKKLGGRTHTQWNEKSCVCVCDKKRYYFPELNKSRLRVCRLRYFHCDVGVWVCGQLGLWETWIVEIWWLGWKLWRNFAVLKDKACGQDLCDPIILEP